MIILTQISAVAVLLGFMYWDAVAQLMEHWWDDPAYSHGPLVVVLAGAVAYGRRVHIQAGPIEQETRGLLLLALGCCFYIAGQLGAEFFLTRLSLLVVTAGLVWTLFGSQLLRRMTFPFLLLLSAIPLPAIVYNRVALPLQLFASSVSEHTLRSLGVVAYREGNVIELTSLTIGIAEACSGLRSVFSLVVLALFVGHVHRLRLAARAVLLVLSVVIALTVNLFRISGTALLVEFWDPAVALDFYHAFGGWLVFLGGFLILWGVASVYEPPNRERSAEV